MTLLATEHGREHGEMHVSIWRSKIQPLAAVTLIGADEIAMNFETSRRR